MTAASPARRLLPLADLLLFAIAMVWGSSYGIVKNALAFYPVLALLALRFGITFCLLAVNLRHLRHASARTLIGVFILGLLLLSIFLAETFGVSHTRAANAAFLISLCVVLTPLVEWALLRRRPGAAEWLTVGVSFGGAWLLAGNGSLAFDFNPGDGLILAAAVLRALAVCATKRVLRAAPPARADRDCGASGRRRGGKRDARALVRTVAVAAAARVRRSRRVLGFGALSRARVHALRVFRTELRDRVQQSHVRFFAHGQRARVWRTVRERVAGRACIVSTVG